MILEGISYCESLFSPNFVVAAYQNKKKMETDFKGLNKTEYNMH